MSEPRYSSSLSSSLLAAISIVLFLAAPAVRAQESAMEDDVDLDTIEAVLENNTKPATSNAETPPASSAPEAVEKDPERLSDLSKLQPFSEVSVIQRKFLPKTERFQFFLGFSAIANDPWFWGIGAAGRFGYHFTEALALELNFAGLSSSEKDAAKDLRSNNAVRTDSIISAQNYLGLDVVWTPIYGKMSLFNRRIVPFDMYFAAGLGQTGLSNAKEAAAPSFHIGGGQIFAMSKGIGFRWDLSWDFYNATPNPAVGSTGTPPGQSQFNNLLLTIGASFFFPEATYR